MGPHMPSTVGNMGEKLFIDIVTLSETVRKKSLFVNSAGWIYTILLVHILIYNKETGTITRVLICEHFSVFGLPNQIHSD